MTEQAKEPTFQEKLTAAMAEESATDGNEENTLIPPADEEAEGQEEELGGEAEAEAEVEPEEDDGIDATPRVSLNKYQKEAERARKAEQAAFEAITRLNAFMEAQKAAAPKATQEQAKPENPYDHDLEPERFELWNTQQELNGIKDKQAKFEQTQQQTEQQKLHAQAINMISNDVAKEFASVKQAGTIRDIGEIFQFLQQKTGELGLPQDFLLGKAITPIQEGRISDVPGIYKNLAISMGYSTKKKGGNPNLDAVERNRGKSASIGKSASASTTGTLNIQDAKPKNGRGVDPAKFRQLLANAERI
jgi:hypothetical protein